MLAQRFLTALILIPLVLGAVYFLPTSAYAGVVAAFILFGAWEWGKLGGLHRLAPRSGYVVVLASLLWIVAGLLFYPWGPWLVFGIGLVWWLAALVRLCAHLAPKPDTGQQPRLALLAAGVPMLVPAWAALVWLHQQPQGVAYVLALLAVVWLADTVAFFAGRCWGRQRLAPTISPGKTREGVYAALLATLVFALGAALWVGWSGWGVLFWVVLNGVTMLFSVVGDLTESVFKREGGVKDSGDILPGHGGVLDRIDSLLAAAPVFALGLLLAQVNA
jgi:phosphatidate cytidylyltransferase